MNVVRSCSFKKIAKDYIPKLNLVTFVGESMISNIVYHLL